MPKCNQQTISAIIIARNERDYLSGCLESLSGHVDSIVLVDTGSSDGTLDIARRHGAKIIEHAWAGDFADARNASLDAASSDWLLYIDADERLVLPDRRPLRDHLPSDAWAGYVRFTPRQGYTSYREWRLFRRDPRIRFVGRIHESVVPSLRIVGAARCNAVRFTDVGIQHLGYEGGDTAKNARDLPLLEAAVRDHPTRTYLWLQIGRIHIANQTRGEAEQAMQQGLAAAQCDPTAENLAAASLIRQVLAGERLSRGDDALDITSEGVSSRPDDYALAYLHGHALLRAGRIAEALAVARGLSGVDPDRLRDGLLSFDKAIFGARAHELAGVALARLGFPREAALELDTASNLAPDNESYSAAAATMKKIAVSTGSGAWPPPSHALVLAHTEGWQDVRDFEAIKSEIERRAPDVEVMIVDNMSTATRARKKAGRLPSLIVSPIRLIRYAPRRGRVYCGRPMPKLEEAQRLSHTGLPVPRFVEITPGLELDIDEFGPLTVVKPSYAFSSWGQGTSLQHTSDVRYIPPSEFPEGHPGRHGPMIAQRFIDCGTAMTCRVLTFFGRPIFSYLRQSTHPMQLDMRKRDFSQSEFMPAFPDTTASICRDHDILELASRASIAFPDIPLLASDILRAKTGELYLLEVNPGGGTWMFSSPLAQGYRERLALDDLAAPFDAFRVCADELIVRTRLEAM